MRGEGREDADWGFEVIPKGTYILTVTEGISVNLSEKSGKESMKIPFKVAKGEYKDASTSMFISTEESSRDFSEQKLLDVMACLGLIHKFKEKFPGDISPLDPKVIDAIKVAFPGKSLEADITNTVKKGKDGADDTVFVNIQRIRKIGSSDNSRSKDKPAAAKEPIPAGASEWD